MSPCGPRRGLVGLKIDQGADTLLVLGRKALAAKELKVGVRVAMKTGKGTIVEVIALKTPSARA